jgi:hypothetical protein
MVLHALTPKSTGCSLYLNAYHLSKKTG